MPATATDKFKKLSKRWVGQIGSGGVADGVTGTIPLASVTNLPTDTAVVVVIDRVDANGTATPQFEETTIGIVSGSNLANCIRGAEGTAQAHNAGAVVEVLFTAKGMNDLIDGLLVSHNQSGYLGASVVVASNIAASAINQGNLNFSLNANSDGWVSDANTWTYASVDGATGVLTINADLTGIIQAGDRIKLTQTTVKYFIVTKTPTFGAGNTTLTIYGGTDYTLANAAITLPNYSHAKAPFGFNTDPTKWAVKVTDTTDRSQASAAASTWYNLGTTAEQITLPIGLWDVSYFVALHCTTASVLQATLSTANNSESDTELTSTFTIESTNFGGGIVTKRKIFTVTSKTIYYLNTLTLAGTTPTIYNRNSSSGCELVILALCAYL